MPPPPPEWPHSALLNPAPEGFVDLSTIEDLWFTPGYATRANPTGERLPGYGAPGAWLRADAAAALAEVQADLRSEGLGLVVYDAYQPARASEGLVAWAIRSDREELVHEGFIARKSLHSTGIAVDVGLVDLDLGVAVDMGGPWGATDGSNAFKNAEWPGAYNREVLRYFMRSHGFRGSGNRWWHFQLKAGELVHHDHPYGCQEKPAGSWSAPQGWHRSTWRHPGHAVPRRCPARAEPRRRTQTK